MIKLSCDSCTRKFKVPEKYRGKTIKCPECGSPILVVSESASPNSGDVQPSQATRSEITSRQPVEGVPAKYPAPWFDPFVGVLMIGLAVGYIALIAAIVGGTVWHTLYNYKNIIAIGDEASFFVFVVYLGIIILGIGIAFFLLKPLLARRQKSISRTVTAKSEPVLFMLLNDVSDFFSLSPVVTCELELHLDIAARHTRDSNGKNAMILGIGFPNLINLSQQQAAALIALEMVEKEIENQSPVAKLIRRIHSWFFDVAQIRDSWDHWLSKIRSRRGFFSTPIVALIQFCVFLNRRILWVFFILSQTISNLSFRSYYRTAAANVIRYVGEDAFLNAIRDLQATKQAFRASLRQFVQSYDTPQAIDDLAGLVEAERKRMDQASILALEMREAKSWTKPWNSKPNLRACQLIASRHENRKARNYFGSAKQLFTNFKMLSRKMTADIHRILMMGDFVQVREFDRRNLNIALVNRLPTGMATLDETN